MDNVAALKIPPQSVEAEQALLGCILRNPELLLHADVTVDDFYRNDHRTIYRAMLKANGEGREPDVVVVGETMDLDNTLTDVGGISYLGELALVGGAASNLNSYAGVVRERAMLREGITIGHQISEAGYGGDLTGMQAHMANSLSQISGTSKNLWTPEEAVKRTLDRIDRVHQGEAPGIPFGVGSLDSRYKAGMKPGQLIVIGARPAMGKTAVALNIALAQKCPVGMISLEMDYDEITQRCLAIKSQVPFSKIDLADMTEHEWKRLTDASVCYAKSGLHVYDLGGATISQVIQTAMKLKAQQDIGLLVIDYAQLINGDKTQSRNDEIGEITRQLKALAKRLHIPILLLAQLNRELEKRNNKRPILADLRESGQIEQDADMVIFLYRDAIYNAVPDNCIEFLIEKCRNGAVDYCKAAWEPELMMLRSTYR